jgi:SAM-dependent methyltransferase
MHNLLGRVRDKLIPPRCANYREVLRSFAGRKGLEIGGPSAGFGSRGFLPVYSVARVDNCVFSETTVWANHGKDTLICEAAQIAVEDASYDFVLASHVLEHCANPLKVLQEWRRVLKPSGVLFMVLPDRRFTFDHRRPVTPLLIFWTTTNRGETKPTSAIWMRSFACMIFRAIHWRARWNSSRRAVVTTRITAACITMFSMKL